MWLDRVLNTPVRQGLHLMARFAEDRHRVLAENLANIDTPDYQARQLDAKGFQAALREALEKARPGERLELRDTGQFGTDARGRLQSRPSRAPAENVLFHDGTNAQIERVVAQIHENALTYRFAMTQLKGKFDGLIQAIRGRNA
ncbi:MAG: flagellar basal body rod protein FlgB [Phycisphaerae bacterium]|nr:flagellar basal body rod protein FlgB [Phycisphaerae bacterium]MCZ2399951.1 flagellar basal body rod protein FlgB [Phycisphaerae bacterium]NUQ48951.1 flagellar basal body rod protein FlgB [Phycisphaerae bacterium]